MTIKQRATLLVLVLAVGGCGGGDGPPDPGVDPLTLFSGTYCIIAFAGSSGATDEANTNWGTLTANGAGTVTGGSLAENENGVVTGLIALPALTYTIDSARKLVILESGAPLFEGRITTDGKVASVASVEPGESPTILIMGRKEGTYSNASLDGPYHLCAFVYDYAALLDSAIWGTVTFDAMGGGVGNGTANDSGTINVGAFPLPYAVAADGTVTSTGLFGNAMTGAILAGGELVILAGGTSAASNPIIAVLIKATTGATNTLLSGSYGAIAMEAPVSGTPDWRSWTVTANPDGAGMLPTGSGTTNADGTIAAAPASLLTYTVAPNGALDVNANDFIGAVSSSGGFAMWAGENDAGADPQLIFLLK